MRLLRDVEGAPPGTPGRPPTRGTTLPVAHDDGPIDVEALLDALAAAFYRSRVRPALVVPDRVVPPAVFAAALKQLCAGPSGITLTPAAVRALTEHYTNDVGKVRYRDFCRRTDNGAILPDPAPSPLPDL
jgi:hypothetical protein